MTEIKPQTKTFEMEIKHIDYDLLRLVYGEDFFPKRPWYRRAVQWLRNLVR